MNTTVYRFEELSPKAQQQAIDDARYDDVDDDEFWTEFIREDWREKLEACGLSAIDFEYGVGHCQSDGAGFVARVDLAQWMKSQKLAAHHRALYNASADLGGAETSAYAAIARDSNVRRDYGGWPEIHIASYGTLDDEGCVRLDAQAEDVQAIMREWYRQQCRAFYRELSEEQLALTSDEYIREKLTNSLDEWYTERGKRW